MKRIKYKGTFLCYGHEGEELKFQMEVFAQGFNQAFFLLTAKAIEEGKCYQLESIQDTNGYKVEVKKLSSIEIFDLRH